MEKAQGKKQKAIALVAEYNPFHKGHLWQLDKIREAHPKKPLIVILSGYYCQRGVPALLPPHLRAKIAVRYGADLVFLLPTVFATASAEQFAASAMQLASALPDVDTLAFGMEDTADLPLLRDAAAQLAVWEFERDPDYHAALKELLDAGRSYPDARLKLLSELIDPRLTDSLKEANHILVFEYLKALKHIALDNPDSLRSYINRFYPTPRIGAAENAPLDSAGDTVMSASQVRELIFDCRNESLVKNRMLETLFDQLPEITLAELLAAEHLPFLADDKSTIDYLLTRLDIDELRDIRYMTGGLAERLYKTRKDATRSLEALIERVRERQFPVTRVQRALLSLLLNIKNEATEPPYATPAYLQVLAFNKRGKSYLRRKKIHYGLPFCTRFSEVLNVPGDAAAYQRDIERRAALLYFKDKDKGHADLLQHAPYLSPSELKAVRDPDQH